ncbi:MAG: Hsp20/alpha crystallin family protein [Hyphomicrobiaceae bacterium]
MTLPSLLPSLWGRDGEHDNSFRSLQHEIDRVFDDFKRGFHLPALTGGNGNGTARYSPRVDVTETDKAIEIEADLPGVEEKDIEVTVSDNVLMIKGERKVEKEDKTRDYHLVERSYGVFQRSIPLGFDVDDKKVDAKYDHGVLKISLPKPPDVAAKTRKIPVKAAA